MLLSSYVLWMYSDRKVVSLSLTSPLEDVYFALLPHSGSHKLGPLFRFHKSVISGTEAINVLTASPYHLPSREQATHICARMVREGYLSHVHGGREHVFKDCQDHYYRFNSLSLARIMAQISDPDHGPNPSLVNL